MQDEVTDEICEVCGRNMVIKYGPHGRFLACPGFPECRNTRPYLEKIGVACPKCGKDIVLTKTTKGQKILWMCGQSRMRFYVLAETIFPKMSCLWQLYGRKRKQTCRAVRLPAVM